MTTEERERALKAAVVKILDRGRAVVGTGYLASHDLIGTCAHVIKRAVLEPGRTASPEGESVEIEFFGAPSRSFLSAVVEPRYYSDAEDVAFLRLRGPVPEGVAPLVFASSRGCQGKGLRGFGFAAPSGLLMTATVVGPLPERRRLQINSNNISRGSSGGPLWDERGRVVAVAAAIKDQDASGRHIETTFAIPVDVIVELCPELVLEPSMVDGDAARLGALSKEDLVAAMAARLGEALPDRIREALLRRALEQPTADARLYSLLGRPGGSIILATGVAGAGKSTWSARHAQARASGQPSLWSATNALRLEQPDPVSMLAAHAAFGTGDVARVADLADLLGRERMRLFIVLDAIDEVHDFRALLAALQEFRTSILAPSADLLLTCREEALGGLGDLLREWRTELLDARKGTLIRLDPLRDRDRTAFLLGEGASPEEARRAEGMIPADLAGIPLFLKQALALVRGASHSAGADGVIEAFARFAIEDIQKRLHRSGRGPSLGRIRRFLAKVALRAITSRTESVDRETVDEILGPDGDVDGEDTLLGRAIHVGLLEPRRDHGIGFGHALYLEYFAASAATQRWPSALPDLESEPGKHIARRLARFIPDPAWLIRALLPLDPVAACDCAARARAVDASLTEDLVRAVMVTLRSRFASDRVRALRVLGNLRGPAPRKAAVDWWNDRGNLESASVYFEAADLFLRLEELGAFEIIVRHPSFNPEFPWYEPAFVSTIRKTSAEFRAGMIAKARERLEGQGVVEFERELLITVLAFFGDTGFIEDLRQRVELSGTLTPAELRALIHANTAEAMIVYAGAIENAIAITVDAEEGTSDLERREQRGYRRDQLLPYTTDVRMHPHDAFLELVSAALSSRRNDHVWFGMQAAELVPSPLLIKPYMDAKRRMHRHFLDLGCRLIEEILAESSAARMRELFEAHEDDDIRAAIVQYAFKIPGSDTERFLIERIDRSEHVFYAVQALGNLGAKGAAPRVLAVYEGSSSPHLRHLCARVLGELEYRPAAGPLAKAFAAAIAEQTDAEANDEYVLLEALGRIGGERARNALVDAFPRTRYPVEALRALYALGDPDALCTASELVRRHDIADLDLGGALGSSRRMKRIDFDHVERDIRDDDLLRRLLASADQLHASNNTMARIQLLRAVARFDLDEATAYLTRVAHEAEGDAPDIALRILAARGDERALRALIEHALSLYTDPRQPVSGHVAEDLSRWPAPLVRDALLARIQGGELVGRWLFLLQWFATDDDVALFERFEAGEDTSSANVAHEILRGRRVGAYARRSARQ